MPVIRSFALKCFLSALSGAIYSAAFPPVGWGWLVFPAIGLFLFVLRGEEGTKARAFGFIHGIVAYGIGLSWLPQLFGPAAVALWTVLSVFPALFAHFQGMAEKKGIIGWKFAVFTMLNWCGWEFIRAELFPLKFPWMTTGLAMGPNVLLPWIGVYGVGLFVIFGVVWIVSVSWRSVVGYSSVLIALLRFISPVAAPAADDPMALKVGALQFEGVELQKFLSVSKDLPTDVKHVIWPEYAVSVDTRTDEKYWRELLDYCAEKKVTLTFGTTEELPGENKWRNIAMTMDADGVRGVHHKNHPVHFFADGTKGKVAETISTVNGKIGTPICFDCDYEAVIRKMTAAGAEVILSPVMDGRAWTARQHDQHAELFRIRACENGRWIFSSASSGVSQAIDPKGQVHARLAAMKEGSLVSTIRRETKLTFYTKAGWLVPWIVLALAAVAWAVVVIPKRKAEPVGDSEGNEPGV